MFIAIKTLLEGDFQSDAVRVPYQQSVHVVKTIIPKDTQHIIIYLRKSTKSQ